MPSKGDLVRWFEYYNCLTTVENTGLGIIINIEKSGMCKILRPSPYNDICTMGIDSIDVLKEI